MYSYLYAVGRYKNYQPGFHLVDISKIVVSNLEKLFVNLEIVIKDNVYDRTIVITLEDYSGDFSNSKQNISGFLDSIGNKSLNFKTKIPKNEYVYAKWESLSHHGFFHSPGNVNLANDRQDKLTSDSAPDVRIKMSNVEYKKYKNINDYCLFISNGALVRSFANNEAIYLLNLGKDYKTLKNDILLSAINFEKIGKVRQIPITESNLKITNTGDDLRYAVVLDKNETLDNKTIWLSFNGQLCTNEDIIFRTGTNALNINPEFVDLTQHYFDYRERTRVPEWTLESNRSKYVKDCLLADNSFIIIIDNPTVGVEVVPLPRFLYPNVFHTEERFEHPVVLENGLLPYAFRKSYGIGERLISIDIHHKYEYLMNVDGSLNNDNIYDTINKGEMGHLPRLSLMKITGINYE